MLEDKNSVQQVLGGLMENPQLLSRVDEYNLTITDFHSRFERYIFAAISGLYEDGAQNIQPIDVENYLSTNDSARVNFEQNNGIEYLQDICELSDASNFPYYYKKLKKINLLRDLSKSGFDTSNFYCDDLTMPHASEINAKFEELSIQDITDAIKKKVLGLETKYSITGDTEVMSMADDIDDFIEGLVEEVDVGLPVQGEIYNKIINGASPNALTIRSGSSGLGKTRQSVGDACYLAYPIRYDPRTCKWVQEGSDERVLFIMTEQSFKEVRRMVLAYISGINDSRFKYAIFTEDEKKRIEVAKKIIKKYEDNLILIRCPNPTIELIKTLVRENVIIHDIKHVFYDYIFIGPSLLSEFKGFTLRNDEILQMMATALKDLAVELGVSVFTSTQVNAKADDNTKIRNEGSLAGGRATINKADNGCICARPTPEELDTLKEITSQYGIPNMVTDMFKVRNGQWTQVRIWSIVDLGIMRKQDLFITDERLNPIEGFYDEPSYHIVSFDDKEKMELEKTVREYNGE